MANRHQEFKDLKREEEGKTFRLYYSIIDSGDGSAGLDLHQSEAEYDAAFAELGNESYRMLDSGIINILVRDGQLFTRFDNVDKAGRTLKPILEVKK